MARLQGISGGMSGRTGSFTYRQSRGQTIVSQYQPIVKNPRTEAQNNQRARFKLMSQLAAIMAPGFGTMSVNKRPAKQSPTQRNAFVALNMPLCAVADGTAKIPMEKLQLTSSSRPLGGITSDESSVTITAIPKEVKSVRFIEINYTDFQEFDKGTGSFIIKTRPEIKRIVDQPTVSTDQGFIAEFDGVSRNSTVLAFGLIPSESLSGVDFSSIHTLTSQKFISAVNLNQLVNEGSMVETMTLGVNIAV